MSEPENVFKQQFTSWRNKFENSNASARVGPVLSDWSDYVKSNANTLYTSLPTSSRGNQAVEEPSWFQLSRFEKLIGFLCCFGASIFCFIICFLMFPVLALKPRKVGLLWSMGSLLFIISFGILQGPNNYIRHLFSRERFVFTTVFFGSVLTTLYCAIVLKSTLLTILASIVELFAILYYAVSYFPFGAQSLTWFSSYIVGYLGGFIGGIL
ncbi:uncharacterized protein PRCAT00000699001 [Priceomyces carsonii]|uniref:uncharacterized protein n=1 Tax=Priceomyces carsonii TaxID=28549 RepID=UPI002ED82C87|nr:unnamed protein product [Priceomyces carsonii]